MALQEIFRGLPPAWSSSLACSIVPLRHDDPSQSALALRLHDAPYRASSSDASRGDFLLLALLSDRIELQRSRLLRHFDAEVPWSSI